MSPNQSPGGSQPGGVRRLNHVPLVLGGLVLVSIVAVFAVAVARRAENSAQIMKEAEVRKTDAEILAAFLTKGQGDGIIPALPPLPPNDNTAPDLVVPVAHVDLDHPPLPGSTSQQPSKPDPEEERIRQIKTQAFQEAVKAKMSGTVPAELQKTSQTVPTVAGSTVQANGTAPPDRWKLNSRPEAPETQYVIRTGSVIPGLMISRINSQLAGPIIAQVSQPIYDTARGKHVLIPAGTRLYGTYSNEVAPGQERVLVAWERLIFPDGKAMDIGEQPGAGGDGVAGAAGEVDNHYARIFGHAILMSLITAGATYSQIPQNVSGAVGGPGNYGYQQTASGALSASLGQQLGQAGSAVLMKNLNIAPTIHVPFGFRLNVVVTKDLTFDHPYKPFSRS
jgi:type IV secretion system protein VirB10